MRCLEFTRRVTLLTLLCRTCAWEWLEQGMVRGYSANNFLPGIGQVMLFHCTTLSTFPKERGGRHGYSHQSCSASLTCRAVWDYKRDSSFTHIQVWQRLRWLKHTSRFSSDRAEVCIQLFSIPCKSLPFPPLNQWFIFF